MEGGKGKLEGGAGPSTSSPRPCTSTGALLNQFDSFAITENHGKLNANSIRVNADEHDNGGNTASNGPEVVAASEEFQHPLLIEVVLRNIFTHFSDLEPLRDSRLVCKTWRDVALVTWRTMAAPKIIYYERSRTYSMNDEERTPLGQFLEFWEDQCQTTPYRQVHLEHWRFEERELGIVTDVTRFWDVVGGHLTKLTLEHSNSEISRDFLRLINGSCPNLETLILKDCSFGGFEIRNQILEWNIYAADYRRPAQGEHRNLKCLHIICTEDMYRWSSSLGMTYMELLSHFPYLTSVHMTTDIEILYFLRAVKKIRMQDPRKLPIRLLATGSPANVEVHEHNWVWDLHRAPPPAAENRTMIQLLRELHIPLQSIELTHGVRLEEVQHLVVTSATVLVTLIALDYYPYVTDPITGHWVLGRCSFPFGVILENLQVLHMLEGFCENLEFLKSTPNLRTLHIRNESEDKLVFIELKGMDTVLFANSSISEMSNVKLLKLTVFELDREVREEDLQCLFQWMPHVQRLQMFLNDNQFTMVCQNWKELIELKVLGADLTDAGVTRDNSQPRAQCSRGNLTDGETLQPNITCLQRLEVFKALVAPLTGVSVFRGFLQLTSLRQIYFPILEKVGDDRAKDALLEKGVKISRQDWNI